LEDSVKSRGSLTIKDIGKLVGVSHSTVSRALNDSPLVNAETREKIKAVARKLNFEFDTAGRSLSNRTTGVIGVIYWAALDVVGNSLYTSQLFLDLRHQLESYELDAILLAAYNPRTRNSNISRLIRQNKVDGLLIVHEGISREDYELMRASGLPIVHLHRKSLYYSMDELDYFVTDNVRGAELACDHLFDQGCGRILTLTSCHQMKANSEFADRVEGSRRSFENHGVPFDPELLVDVGYCSFEAGYRLVYERPELFEKIDGVFAHADIIAFGCMSAMKEKGIAIPGDIKVIGFDDGYICDMIHPAISSIHQPREELSRQACRRIHGMLNHEAGSERLHTVLEPRLVIRGSTKRS
jgi:LacI family transcriptional regulator